MTDLNLNYQKITADTSIDDYPAIQNDVIDAIEEDLATLETATTNSDSHIADVTTNPHSVTIDQISPTTTKGDILVDDGTVLKRLPVGTNTQVLGANDSTALGVAWQDAGTPAGHNTTHQDGGADEISVQGLSGIPVDLDIHAKTTLTIADTDEIGVLDASDSYLMKKYTWVSVKTAIATYYNSLSATLTNKILTSPTINTPTLVLSNSVPTSDGWIGFDRTNEDLVVGDGTNGQVVHMGVWKTWTPTFTNLTIGNGTLEAKYTQIGKTVMCRITLIFGSTTSISAGIPKCTLPVPMIAAYGTKQISMGTLYMENLALAGYDGSITSGDATNIYFIAFGAADTNVTHLAISATVPFTWATGDFFTGTFTYEAA